MLICSIITYFFITRADQSNAFSFLHPKTPLDFFPSLTFTHPIFWAKLFHNSDINYVNLSYWSLWVEITFYLLCSLLFFMNKQKFVRNWMLLLLPLIVLKIIGAQTDFGNTHYVSAILRRIAGFTGYFNFCKYAAYFSLGILFYCLFFSKKISKQSIALCVLCVLVEAYYLNDNILRIMLLAVIVLFMLFIYRPAYISFLNNRVLTRIGIISYSLYLIHENTGVLLINKFGTLTTSSILVKIFPVFLILVMIAFSEMLYRFYEKPVNNLFRKRLLSRAAKKKADELQPG
jgi:peptidoglycan/LPS O-acetylase OafA/YrhL